MARNFKLGFRIGAEGGDSAAKEVAQMEKAIRSLKEEAAENARVAAKLKDTYNLKDDEVEAVRKKMAQLTDETKKAEAAGGQLNGVIAGLAAGAAFKALDLLVSAFQAAAQAVAAFVSSTLEVGGAAQQSQVAFEVMLGGAEAAQAVLEDLSDFAASTPFDLPGIRQAGQQLLAFGFEQDQLIATLERVGNVSAGVNTDFNELATIYGKARVQGRLFAEDINQLTERGIPIIGELAKQFGVAESQVRVLVESGQVGFPELEQAFINLTSAGGQFAGLMEAQSRTIPGQISNLGDNFTRFQEAVFNAFEPLLAGGLTEVAEILAAAGEAFTGFDPIIEAGERLQLALEANSEIADSIGAALASLGNEAVEQIALLVDEITAFVAEEGNIEAVALQIERLGAVITVAGQAARFLVALADGFAEVTNAARDLPAVGDSVERIGPSPTALGIAIEAVRALTGALNDLFTAASRFEGSGISDEALGQLSQGFEELKATANELATAPPPGPDPLEVEAPGDALKRLAQENSAALEQIATDSTNAQAALLEQGATQEQIATAEAEALQKRVTQNRTYLAELREIQAQGGLSDADATVVADEIRKVEADLASDRVATAKASIEQAEQATEALIEQAEKEATAIEEARDRERDAAETAYDEAATAAERAYEDATTEIKNQFDDRVKAQQDAVDTEVEAIEAGLDKAEAAAGEYYDKRQEQLDKQITAEQNALAKRQSAEREAAEELFSEEAQRIERELALRNAESPEERRELEAQFDAEDETAEQRAKAFADLEAEREAFEAAQIAEQEAQAQSEVERQEALDAQRQDTETVLAQQRQDAETYITTLKTDLEQYLIETRRQYEEDERTRKREFEDQQQTAESAFNQQQRTLDEQSAHRQADLLAAARGSAPTPRRMGGPVEAGQAYLVGEAGPELIYPNQAGWVADTAKTAAILSARETAAISAPSAATPTLPLANTPSPQIEGTLKALLKEVQRGHQTPIEGGNFTFVNDPDPWATTRTLQENRLKQLTRRLGL